MFGARRREGNNAKKEKFVVRTSHFSYLEEDANAAWQKLRLLRHAKWHPSGDWLGAWSRIRDLALINLGFYTVRRSQELSELLVSDLRWSEDDNGFWLTLRSSKTDQYSEGRDIFWPSSLGTASLSRYLQVRERLLKSCAQGRWESSKSLFVNLSGARLGLGVSVETVRKVLKKRIPTPEGPGMSGVPSIRRGGAEWWMQCTDPDKARLIARSVGGWKSFTMLGAIYRETKPSAALITSVAATNTTSAGGKASSLKTPLITKTVTNPTPSTLVGAAQSDIELENAKSKLVLGLNRVDGEQVPGLVLEALARRIIDLSRLKKNSLGWVALKKFKCYAVLKREILDQGCGIKP